MKTFHIPKIPSTTNKSIRFPNDVIEQVRLDALKDRLRQLVEKRFRGELAKCSGCQACR